MTYQDIAVSVDGALAEIRLNRPDSRNTLDEACLSELHRAADWIAGHDGVHAVILAAAGEDFCAGWADDAAPSAPAAAALRALELLPQPVIACIEGAALGAGLELALACDVRVAGEGASFAMTQVSDGGVPGLGGTQRLPRLIGRANATEMILLGTALDGEAALRAGLVSDLTPAGGAEARGREIARAIALQGPVAVRYAKEAIRQGLDMPLEQALRFETDLTVILQTTADRAEGVRAFLEKRPPKFEGR